MNKIQILIMTDDQLDKSIRIQGTPYDRKRKLSESTLRKMNKMYNSGKTPYQIAKELGLNYSTVRYNTDKAFKAIYNATRDGRHTGKDKISVKNRVAYKRQLVAQGKVAC